jgi:hypothetical protein
MSIKPLAILVTLVLAASVPSGVSAKFGSNRLAQKFMREQALRSQPGGEQWFGPCRIWADTTSEEKGLHFNKVDACIKAGGPSQQKFMREQALRSQPGGEQWFGPCRIWADTRSERKGLHFNKVDACIKAGGPSHMKQWHNAKE